MSEIKYSIILPVYKIDEAPLRKCLNSLLADKPENVEIILIDDNDNQDLAGQICDEYVSDANHVIVRHQVNQGVSVARNHGMEISNGEYLIFVDPDDWVGENFYSKIDDATTKNFNSDIILFAAWISYKDKTIKNSFWRESEIFRDKDKEQLQLQLIAKGVSSYFPEEIGVGVPWSRVFKKSFIEKNNLIFQPPLRRMQDNIFNMYAFEYANEIVYIDEPIYYYRKSQSSATNKKNDQVIYYFDLVNNAVEMFIKEFKKDQIFKDGLDIKRLIGINSYYRLYYRFYRNSSEFKQMNKEYRKLLHRPEYAKSLSDVKYEYLLGKEKIFISALKTKQLYILDLLEKGEQLLSRMKRKELE